MNCPLIRFDVVVPAASTFSFKPPPSFKLEPVSSTNIPAPPISNPVNGLDEVAPHPFQTSSTSAKSDETPSPSQQPSKSARAPPDPEKVQAALAMLVEIGYSGITEDDLGKLNPADEYETELRVMAQTRGYFQVAYKVCVQSSFTHYRQIETFI